MTQSGLGVNQNFGRRADVEGLRGLAVLAVLAYHVWPEWVPGGYIGVDIFFVLSGFLITGLISEQLSGSPKPFSLREFYARRILRLVPAAAVVLAAVTVSYCFVLPDTEWNAISREIIASVLNVQNIWLAHKSVDYLAAEGAASPVLHFWSLSVEEQFYLFWPLALLGAASVARKLKLSVRNTLTLMIATICVGSLCYAIVAMTISPSEAYFLTFARVWELCAGGLLAVVNPRRLWPHQSAALGVGIILISSFYFSSGSGVPGGAALLPVLGGLLVLWGRSDRTYLSWGVLVRTGNISYSLYLWHWPIITYFTTLYGEPPGFLQGIALIALSYLAAWISFSFVESRFRVAAGNVHSTRKALLPVGASMLVALSAVGVFATVSSEEREVRAAQTGELSGSGVRKGEIYPATIWAKNDLPGTYRDGCNQGYEGMAHPDCKYGAHGGVRKVVLIGDSHAAAWFPAIERIAKERNWTLYSFTKSGCPLVGVQTYDFSGRPYPECHAWMRKTFDYVLDLKPDVVVTTLSARTRSAGSGAAVDNVGSLAVGLSDYWSRIENAGISVVAISATPEMAVDVPRCVASNLTLPQRCDLEQSVALLVDPIRVAADKAHYIDVIDMTDQLCPQGVCKSVIGNYLVYRDSHHLTATFSRAIAPVLGARLISLVESSAVDFGAVSDRGVSAP